MKAQVTIVEMIISVIVLFIAFSILFPGFSFKSRWDEALLLTKGRDIILTMERTNNLAQYSFNSDSFQKFNNQLFPLNDTLIWTEIEDAIKSKVVIACNCTNESISSLSYWLKDLKINNRSVTTFICYTNLEEKINPCVSNIKYPDVLVIWGYQDLSKDSKYSKLLKDFLNDGNGIVEISDLNSSIDNVQQQIFGIANCSSVIVPSSCNFGTQTEDSFNKPATVYSMTYQPFKNFYHVPFPAKAPEATGMIPVEPTTSPCLSSTTNKGNFTFREKLVNFWICNDSFVYFDSNNNNQADYVVGVRNSFNISNYNFTLSYISNSGISISFRQTYNFADFLKDGNTKVFPGDSNIDRIFLSMGNYPSTSSPIPVVILNGTFGKTAWVADFSRTGLSTVEDDQKQLLISLIFSVSNKKPKELIFGNTKIGYATSYLNVLNYDMFEVYRLNLGVGRPF